jgi:hypothetical protein
MSETTKTNGKEAITEAIAKLTAMLQAGNSDALTAYLKAMGNFHKYSWGNQLLIWTQCPDATRVAGFNAWKDHNRFVKKGSKAIRILAPMVGKKKDEASAEDKAFVFGFRSVCVFDVSQTDGEALPEFATATGDASQAYQGLLAYCASNDITVTEDVEDILPAKGMSEGGSIKLAPCSNGAELFSTFTHEVAHELMHKGDKRKGTTKNSRELEAEAVAFIVGSSIGLDMTTSSVDYIKLYNGDADGFASSLEIISRTASIILDAVAA